MSVSVNYKGSEILNIPSKGSYKLNTHGKYLEDDIQITNSGGSSAVVVTEEPDTNGGIIKNITAVDISDTTAVASDVAQGKYFYTADGIKTAGTASGGGGGSTPWVRPSDWPDLSKMDVSDGDIIYMTSYADEARGFCSFYVDCTGSYTVEVGTISGSTFTAESTQSYSSGSYCVLYYGSANGTYKVLKVTGTAITKLNFRANVTTTIGAFHGFSSNQGIIDIVGRLPSCTYMYFYQQRNIVNIEISDVVLSGSMSNIFSGCYSLTSLDVSGWDTSSVTNMYAMFYYCCSLTSLDVSRWDTGAVTDMTNMFNSCSSLISLDVSSWDTSSVTNMSSMFSSCFSLTSLDVSRWDTGAVTNMSGMFYSCASLASLDISGWDFSGVTTESSTSGIFQTCYGLYGSLTLPASVTVIGSSCFSNCRSLYEWHFLSTTPPTLVNTNAFNNMTNFDGKKIYVPAASLSAYQTATNWSTYASYMVGE